MLSNQKKKDCAGDVSICRWFKSTLEKGRQIIDPNSKKQKKREFCGRYRHLL
jgi:hypothetical protein